MNIYFSGIGGVGLGPLAELAHDAGHNIFGSDLAEGLMTKDLTARGITINIGQDGSYLREVHASTPIDWLVYTAALPADHPELAVARELKIKTTKRDELVNQIITDKKLSLIAVAGTHGKTTATAMLVWALRQLNVPVSYTIGTTISFGPSGQFAPDSKYFIYECDEFDRNMLHFSPHLSIVTSLDYDHPDTYPTADDYLAAFRQFGQQSCEVYSWADQHSEAFEGLASAYIIDKKQINANIKLAGIHNRRNATLVQIALQSIGIDQDTDDILSNFPGTNRRFEKLADNLYSDYGHHPAEIAATLQMASELPSQIVLVYQPHQNSRQHEIRDQYTNQFELASDIYWLPTYLSREDPKLVVLKPSDLIQHITNKSSVHIVEFNDELWDTIQKARGDGKLVIGMGAGAIDGWLRQQLAN